MVTWWNRERDCKEIGRLLSFNVDGDDAFLLAHRHLVVGGNDFLFCLVEFVLYRQQRLVAQELPDEHETHD